MWVYKFKSIAVLVVISSKCMWLACGLNNHLLAFSADILVNSAQADLTVKDKDLNTSLHLASSKVCK